MENLKTEHSSMDRYAPRPPLSKHNVHLIIQAPTRTRHRSPSPARRSPPHNWQPTSSLEAELDDLGRAVVGLTRSVTPDEAMRALEPSARWVHWHCSTAA